MEDWSLIGVRFALYLAMAALFGLAAFSLYALRGRERDDALALRPLLVSSAGLSLLISAAWVVLTASSMAGTPAWPVDREAVGALLTGSAIGAAWKLRMVMLALAALAALVAGGRGIWLGAVALCSAVALATLAWTGHGAMDEAAMGWVHLIADILHLIASGAWVGALLGLVLLVSRPAARVDSAHLGLTHRALHGFGAVGTIVVGTIVVTGLVNGWMLVGINNLAALQTTLYGQLLLAKLALFAAMLGLASLNRFRLTPAFERSIAADDHGGALAVLRTSLAVETACVVAILGLVAWLGTLAPPASAM
ncbi:MAG: copper homeostasis membrane protein CopD [Blastomonas fulva]|uniref:copper homeostasis membrane protein CopD n=1 Tax=Blastomonas fulva TaxID=1550728 RepID=UPI0024E26172|nr:copper homeostasis membrane protein CopD [Blastomonas fulva]MDK2759325.1 copper homeostasis membrane protein CopD [Blastomonas fulva]